MTSREDALEKLRAQIAAQREKIDPKVLKAAQRAAEIAQNPQKSTEDLVPYDRESAAEAIRLFLSTHADSADFEKKLLEQLKKQQH